MGTQSVSFLWGLLHLDCGVESPSVLAKGYELSVAPLERSLTHMGPLLVEPWHAVGCLRAVMDLPVLWELYQLIQEHLNQWESSHQCMHYVWNCLNYHRLSLYVSIYLLRHAQIMFSYAFLHIDVCTCVQAGIHLTAYPWMQAWHYLGLLSVATPSALRNDGDFWRWNYTEGWQPGWWCHRKGSDRAKITAGSYSSK